MTITFFFSNMIVCLFFFFILILLSLQKPVPKALAKNQRCAIVMCHKNVSEDDLPKHWHYWQ